MTGTDGLVEAAPSAAPPGGRHGVRHGARRVPTVPAVVVHLHVQPGAGRDGVSGRHGDALKVRVRAPAADGRANEAVLGLVAEVLGVARRDVDLVAGHRSRSKRVRVTGIDLEAARARVRAALETAAPG